jgi:hypothetical protein
VPALHVTDSRSAAPDGADLATFASVAMLREQFGVLISQASRSLAAS